MLNSLHFCGGQLLNFVFGRHFGFSKRRGLRGMKECSEEAKDSSSSLYNIEPGTKRKF